MREVGKQIEEILNKLPIAIPIDPYHTCILEIKSLIQSQIQQREKETVSKLLELIGRELLDKSASKIAIDDLIKEIERTKE